MTAIERLKEMVNKAFLYKNEEVVILGYCDRIGDDGDDVEIYLNNGKTLEFNIHDLYMKLDRFRPITETVIILANERLNQVSTVNPAIIQNLRDVILDQIKSVKEKPEAVSQAKQVFQGVNTLINLAKTELEYRKYLDKMNDNENIK
jgi:ATP-dependent RNA circularization protein (DNA/RNA ligase family)